MNWIKLKSSLTLTALSLTAVLLSGCFTDPNQSGANAKFVFPGEPQTPIQVASNSGGPVTTRTLPNSAEDFAKLRVGELLTVTITDVPPPGILEQRIRISPEGMITLPYNVRVKAAGRTTSELQEDIRNAYVPQIYVNLTANVKAEERVYFVGGEVKNPGRQLFLGEMTVTRAIDTAGGFTDFANKKKIQLRRANGETHIINWYKVNKDFKFDLPVFSNDQIMVPRSSL